MSETPPDCRAYRQTCMATIIAAFGGFFLCLAGGSYLLFRSHMRWWEMLPSVMTVLVVSPAGGLLIGAGVGNALNCFHYRRGVYRCVRCNRPLKNDHSPCLCEGASEAI